MINLNVRVVIGDSWWQDGKRNLKEGVEHRYGRSSFEFSLCWETARSRGGLCSPEDFRWQSPCWVVQRRVSRKHSAIHRIPASSQLSSRSTLYTTLSWRIFILVSITYDIELSEINIFFFFTGYFYLSSMISSSKLFSLLQASLISALSSEADHYLAARSPTLYTCLFLPSWRFSEIVKW